jgi:endonuclease III-like uncharacterized protein
MMMVEDIKKDSNNSIKEIQENTAKQVEVLKELQANIAKHAKQTNKQTNKKPFKELQENTDNRGWN